VICVDPTSPLSGGATLGDRVRLSDYHADDAVFIRSMASRGHRGGLATATSSVAHVLDAAGFDPILIETLGVGQDETEISQVAHTVAVLQVPNLGDSIQTLKAGILEIADVLVVNKADLPEADRLVRDLTAMLSLADRTSDDAPQAPVVRTSAATSTGVDRLVEALESRRHWLEQSGRWQARQRELATAELSRLVRAAIDERLNDRRADDRWTTLVQEIAARRRAPGEASQQIIGSLDPSTTQRST
jgi:LAO/AO transport system kinase